MMDIRKKILNQFEETVNMAELDVAINKHNQNEGMLYVQPEYGLNCFLELSYRFEENQCHFTVEMNNTNKELGSVTLEYKNGSDIEKFFNSVYYALVGLGMREKIGEIELDEIHSTLKNKKDRIVAIREIVENNEHFYEEGVPEEKIIEESKNQGIDEEKTKELLTSMRGVGELYCPKRKHYKITPD